MNEKSINLEVIIERATDKGLLVRPDPKIAPRWLSREMIKQKFPKRVEEQKATITVPEWLAIKIGLV